MSALQVALKEEGNESFAKGHWKDAIDSYTEAIRMKGDDEVLAVLYSNRSAAYMKCGKHQAVREGMYNRLPYTLQTPLASHCSTFFIP